MSNFMVDGAAGDDDEDEGAVGAASAAEGPAGSSIKLYTFGRLNPATPGHILIINSMIDAARTYINTEDITPDIHFILSDKVGEFKLTKTYGDETNPFFCEGSDVDTFYKKNFVIEMISNMVSTNYPDITFIINPDVENIVINRGKKNIINIYVRCVIVPLSYMHRIIDMTTNMRLMHLFFGDDQRGFANTLATSLSSKNIAISTTILTRKLCNEGIDLKEMSVDQICEIVERDSVDDLASFCSSSAVKKLVKSNTPRANDAIHKIYSNVLDSKSIDNMILNLRTVLAGVPGRIAAEHQLNEENKAFRAAERAAERAATKATTIKKKTTNKTTVKPLSTVDKITERGKVLKASGISIPSSPRPALTAIIGMSTSPRSPLTARRARRTTTKKGGNRMRTRKTRRTKKTRRRQRKTKKH